MVSHYVSGVVSLCSDYIILHSNIIFILYSNVEIIINFRLRSGDFWEGGGSNNFQKLGEDYQCVV